MNYLIKPPKQFFISEEYTSLVPNEIRHFIVWVACQQPRTVYANGNVHCPSSCYRSIDDIYHLVSHKWQISEEEYLNILVKLFSSRTKYKVQTVYKLCEYYEGVIYPRYCSEINRITAVYISDPLPGYRLSGMVSFLNEWDPLYPKTRLALEFFKSKV
jgi:hypothetical protein